mmetsp:Transcript_48263/g.78406  ORF Transcript_48263/g.78406 Transcript_48263/m.78406 type:complete len:111 (-) Transcript_48263:135-467(-)
MAAKDASKKAAEAKEDIKETSLAEEDEDDKVIRDYERKTKARKKYRQKKLQYQFMFKAGAFLVMLVVVLITKQFQKWYKPEGDASSKGSTEKVVDMPSTDPISQLPKGEL